MQKLLISLFLFFVISFASAQQVPGGYLKAKTNLDTKQYELALLGFGEFLAQEKYGDLAYYAALHSAEAALGLNQPAKAIALLTSVRGTSLANTEALTYLLSLAYFQNNQAVEALNTVNQLKTEPYLQMGYRACFNNLKSASPNFFVTNLEQFKKNEGFTAALAFVLQQKTILSVNERAALNQVMQSGSQTALKDKVLDVVVILPFTSGPGQEVSALESSNFVLELYQGIELQVASLKAQGVGIQLHTFDSKRDLSHLNALVKDPTVLAADIIIGPIYPEESELISAFAEVKKIPFIHPLSNLSERFEDSQYSYLFRPSVSSMANGVGEALTSQGWGANVAIGYSGSARDEQMAQLLGVILAKKGFNVIKSQQIDPKNATTFLQGLGVRRGNRPTVDQVILLTDDPAIAQPIFSLMESISTKVPLLVMDSWLGFNFSNYEMLEFSNFYFIANNTPKYNSKAMEDFRTLFYEKHLIFPSTNALLGAELISWVQTNAEFAHDYDLRARVDQRGFQEGQLTWGFNFQKVNNNSYSPVFKLESGELIPLR